MKSWMMRRTFARWCSPPFRSARGFDVPASAPSRPSIHASATPPRPPPERQRNSRRDGDCGDHLGRSLMATSLLRGLILAPLLLAPDYTTRAILPTDSYTPLSLPRASLRARGGGGGVPLSLLAWG